MARTFHNHVTVPMPRNTKPVQKVRGGAKNNKLELLSDYDDEEDDVIEESPESLPPQAA